MAYQAASVVSEGLYALLQDAAVQAALDGGVHDDIPEDPTLPLAWVEIVRESDQRGFGTGGLPQIDLRVHVYSKFEGKAEGQEASRLIVGVLKDAAVTITGYRQCGRIFYDDTTPLSDQELNGVKVHEFVSAFRIYAEEA